MLNTIFLFLFLIFSGCATQPSASVEYNHNKVSTKKISSNFDNDHNQSYNHPIRSNSINMRERSNVNDVLEFEDDSDTILPNVASDDYKIIYHEVVYDETLEDIAMHYDQSTKEIAILNNLSFPYNLKESQILKIRLHNQMINQKNNEYKNDIWTYSNNKFIKPVIGKVIVKFGEQDGDGISKGINIVASAGSEIKSIAGGRVIYSGYDKKFGNLIIVKLDNTDLYVAYAHMEELILKQGDVLSQGDLVGYVGQTGNVTSPQLHYAVRRGNIPINPLTLE